MKVPIFVETVSGPASIDAQVCRKTMGFLFKLGVAPLPFASTNEELASVKRTLRSRNLEEGIYIVNAFGTEHLFPELDRLIDDCPAIFLRRELFSHTKCLEAVFGEMDALTASQYLGTMTPRMAVAWPFGPRNSGEVGEAVAKTVRNYLNEGDFNAIERVCPKTKRSGTSLV
jgi:hypothetical protein